MGKYHGYAEDYMNGGTYGAYPSSKDIVNDPSDYAFTKYKPRSKHTLSQPRLDHKRNVFKMNSPDFDQIYKHKFLKSPNTNSLVEEYNHDLIKNKIDLPKLNTIDYKQQSRDLVKQSTLTNSIEEDSKALFNSKILYFMTSHRSCCRKAYSKWYDESRA